MDTGRQIPLVELLQKVPRSAVFQEHTPNPLGFDTARHPVGALCQDAAARIAALEAALAAAKAVVQEQAEDDGLWFRAELITEEKLQIALRRLHAVIEGEG